MTNSPSSPEIDTAAYQDTDDAEVVKVLAAVRHCANSWDGSVRLVGNVRARDISRACTAAIAALQPSSAGMETPEELKRERDEARQLVIEANNSLYGSQGYFHSLNGGPFDKYHLSRGIEDLKAASRQAHAAAQASWQPIETAPTSGGILGFQATPGDYENQMSVCWPFSLKDGGATVWIGSGGLTPTHWMPLPKGPALPSTHEAAKQALADQAQELDMGYSTASPDRNSP